MKRRVSFLLVGSIIALSVCLLSFRLALLSSSLWLDETVTHYLISSSFSSLVERYLNFHIQSAFPYFAIQWLFSKVFGYTEVALRLPSVVFALLSAVVLYRLARRWFLPFPAFAGVLAYVVSTMFPQLGFAARPYGLGLLCLLFAFLTLEQWRNSPSFKNSALHLLSVLGIAYSQFLWLPVILVFLFTVAVYSRQQLFRYLGLLALGFPFLIPVFYQILEVSRRTAGLAWVPQPGLANLNEELHSLYPTPFLIILGLGFVAALIFERLAVSKASLRGGSWTVLLLWLLLGPAFAFLASRVAGVSIFSGRYFAYSFPAWALVFAKIVSALPSTLAQKAYVLGAVFAALIGDHGGRYFYGYQDWAGALAYAREHSEGPTAIVLFNSGLVEANNPVFLNDAEAKDYVMAPTSPYPLPGELYPLPWQCASEASREIIARYVSSIEQAANSGQLRFWFIEGPPKSQCREYLVGQLASHGFLFHHLRSFGSVDDGYFARDGVEALTP